MKRLALRERAFKRVAFLTTFGGLVVMAIGLQQALFSGRWLLALLLFTLGGAVALSSVVIDLIPEAGFVVTLYTREGCTLCEAARDFLVGKKAEFDYDVWEVDVDKDPAALEKYGDWVPVAVVGDEELFRLDVDVVRAQQKLREWADARLKR